MPDHLYAALGRLAHLAQGQKPSDRLIAALRESARLTGAGLLVLRLPEGSCECVEVRWPETSTWPSARTLSRWQTLVGAAIKPVRLALGVGVRQRTWKHAVAMPIFSATGSVGMIAAFSNTRPLYTQAQCSTLSLPVHSVLARIEAARLQAQTETLTAVDVHDRLAREIHDGPLQTLAGVLLHVRLAGRGADPSSREALSKLDGDLRQAVTQMRALIRRLRLAHPEASLESRVRSALTRLQQTRGIVWTLRWREPEGLMSSAAADEMFHVINEALANVYRHSQAGHVNVVGRPRSDDFEVVVRDDGVGFNVAEALRRDIRSLSFGLVGMQERMNALGGTLTLRSQPGQGTRVVLSVPLARSAAGKSA